MIAVRDTPAGATFCVRVQPRAKKTAITGVMGIGEVSVLKVALNAPPLDGRANQAMVEFFAELLGVARSQVNILAGEKSRAKVIRVQGLTAEDVLSAIRRVS
ncbi:hypothetical protein ACPOL_0470 [Acidisarcina polymorpha]|uniref:UPF0235 protein ACPOL_0470 n=1 Tax=Acidisarcina polymorpha TaxID=2211140 RepID=A0A2Z5FTM0_9BACT|nr:DUF167 domain-containing protein [Acidisarcina polymorpha]AXC09847.1 hypothetical protein ACPOL_0470 [Acidisarcina polymorpha]